MWRSGLGVSYYATTIFSLDVFGWWSSCGSRWHPTSSTACTIEHPHAEHVERVIGLAERSMHEAIRQSKDPQIAASVLQELAASVAELEVSHPQLVNVVNAISMLLSNIGI